jgi:hypothetical protein
LGASIQGDYYDAIVLAVAHREFRELGVAGIRRWVGQGGARVVSLEVRAAEGRGGFAVVRMVCLAHHKKGNPKTP